MGNKYTIATDAAPAAIGPYAQAIEVAGSGFVFTSGQIAIDPSSGEIVSQDVSEQTRQVMANLKAVLAAGGTGLDRAVKTTIYLKDMGDFQKVNEVYASYFLEGQVPARSTVEVSRLPKDALVEIDMIAIR